MSDDLIGELRKTNDIVLALVDEIKHSGNTQTVIHKTSGNSFVAGFAVAACIAVLGITYEANSNTRERIKELSDKLRDNTAWLEVTRGKVATLEGKINQPTQGAKQP